MNENNNPWPDLVGKYNDDPSWKDFPRWLKEYRRKINVSHALHEEGVPLLRRLLNAWRFWWR